MAKSLSTGTVPLREVEIFMVKKALKFDLYATRKYIKKNIKLTYK